MNLRNLEYFLVAAEELNFTRAADRLFITQQSLSHHIQKLESEFGTPLFERTPPMTLTPAGACFLRHAKKLINSMDEMELEIQDIKDFKKSELTIGITRARGAVYLPMLLPRFAEAFPQVRINLVEESSARLEAVLREGKADLIIGMPPRGVQGITSEIVWHEKYLLIVPYSVVEKYIPEKKGYLMEHPGRVTLKDFEKCPFLSVQRDMPVGRLFWQSCLEDEIEPHVVLESKNSDTVLALCLEGMGALVCPEMFLYPYRNQNGRYMETEVMTFPMGRSDQIAVSYLTNKYRSIGARRFIDLTREVGKAIQGG